MFTLSSGQEIMVRGKLADGRWDNAFTYILDFDDIAQTTLLECSDTSLKWCVRQRGQTWFISRCYSPYNTDRGFVILPLGYDVNKSNCYINPSATATPDPIIGNYWQLSG